MVGSAEAFFDYSDNDYSVDVDLSDPQGRITEVSVPRFHDRYRAAGANAEIGVVGKPCHTGKT